MFKSCYPNSYLGGNPADPPTTGPNPLRGQDAYDDSVHTVANAKGIYNDLLTYFATRQDKLFVVITAPPQMDSETDASHAANARAFNDWLVEDWLDGYAHDNVAVFDFYNVLTSNGGGPHTNDLGAAAGNHHRWWDGAVQHVHPVSNNYSAYPGGSGGGSHPTAAGNQKATGEFVPLLNVFYNRWSGGNGIPTATSTATHTPTATPTATLTPSVYLPLILSGWSNPTPTPTSTGSPVAPTATSTSTSTPTPTATTEVPAGLLQPTDLVYLGAFAYPSGDAWAYSGHALAYYPGGDPTGPSDGYPGSLYAAGSAADGFDLAGEMDIPEPVIADSFGDLPTASALQSLSDITGAWKDNCTYAAECQYRDLDGLAYLPNVDRIAWNVRDWYNVAAHDQDSLGWSNLDLTGAQGVWHIGDRPSDNDLFHNAKACNYLFRAPQSFADGNLDGKWLIAGNHREAGALGGSQGPTLYALAPWEDGNPPAAGQNLDALVLLYYRDIYGCVWEAEGDINEHPAPGVCDFPGYRAMDFWGGGAWVQTAEESGILIVGRKGWGITATGRRPCVAATPAPRTAGTTPIRTSLRFSSMTRMT